MQLDFLINILLKDKPSQYIKNNEKQIFDLIPELSMCKNFNQNNIWHIYDVYDHILNVIDGVPNNIIIRIAALFHDIGKPLVYTEDEMGIGHFYNHWNKSNEIFLSFAKKNNLNNININKISNLIIYHDLNVSKLSDEDLKKILIAFNEDDIINLFQLKKSDLLAQNNKFHYLLSEYEKQEKRLLDLKSKEYFDK